MSETTSRRLSVLGSLRNKLLVWFLLISLIPLMGLGAMAVLNARNALQQRAFGELEALRIAKTRQLESHFREQRRDMSTLVDAVMALRAAAFNKLNAVRTIKHNQLEAYFAARQDDVSVLTETVGLLLPSPTDEAELVRAIQESQAGAYLVRFKETYGYDNVYFIDPTGTLLYAVEREADYQTNLLTGPYKDSNLGRLVAEVLRTGESRITDFERYAPSGYEPAAFIAQPVSQGSQVVGVVALRLSIDGINTIMQEHTGLGETGETYLVGVPELNAAREFGQFYFRSDSRLVEENTILNSAYLVDTEAARQAMAGRTGHGTITNYHSRPVLSSWAPLDIAGLRWAVIAEIDVEEAFTPPIGSGKIDFFTQYRNEYGYPDLYLISPAGGYVFYSVQHKPDYQTSLLTGTYQHSNLGNLVAEVLNTRQFGVADFARYAPGDHAPAAFMAQPLTDTGGDVEIIVAAQLSLERINAIMHEHTGLGETSEIYLVGSDQLWRSDSRFLDQLEVESTVLNPKTVVDTVAARRALAGEAGTRMIDNYQGTRVLGSWSPVAVMEPTTNHPTGIRWAVIAEIEESEVNQPVVRMMRIAGTLAMGTIILIVGVTLLVSRTLSAPIVEVADAAMAVAGGDLSRRAEVRTGDEIERMAEAFNHMAAEIVGMFTILRRLANTDSLTGLYNRRHFFELAEHEFERAQRYDRPLSVIILDVDEFKQVNDTHGHIAGDRVLQVLAKLCQANLREADLLGRYGGEEFVALLPESDLVVARRVVERLRQQVAHTAVDIDEGVVSITISVGVAARDESCPDVETLLDCADRALYAAKHAGRNRVSAWTENVV